MNLEDTWRRFREDDAAAVPPSSVDEAVTAAWSSGRFRRAERHRRSRVTLAWASVAAAALVAGIALGAWWASASRSEPPAAAPASAEPPVMTLAADPIFDGEPLQIVRVRMPRRALTSLGFTLVEPEAAGLVDVDVLVGSDGLPRDIRRVTAVATSQERP